MDNRKAFIKAHAMTKATIKPGEDYAATFGQCLKIVKSGKSNMDKIRTVGIVILAIILVAWFTALFAGLGGIMVGIVSGSLYIAAWGIIIGGIVGAFCGVGSVKTEFFS